MGYTPLPLVDAQSRSYPVVELPTISPPRHGLPYCFVYMWAPFAADSAEFGAIALVKRSLCGEGDHPVQVWQVPNHFPSEPVFVPRPATDRKEREEDDGVVLSVVYDGDRAANYLVVLDGRTMQVVATLYCGGEWAHLMSFGIHGHFFPRTGTLPKCES